MDHALNWLWQGILLAIGAAAVLTLLDRSRARVRHHVCWLAIAAVLALPLLAVLHPGPAVPGTAAVPPDGLLILPRTWWTSSTLAASLWIVWFSFHAMRVTAAARAVRRARRDASAFPAEIEQRLRFWCSVKDGGRRIRLVLSDGVRSAGVLGGGRPVIAVAPLLLEYLEIDELDRVIVHEWAHAQRFDDLTHTAELMVRAAAGWHPAIWWLVRRLRIEREIACDEAAVAVTGSSKAYAACLATLAVVGAGRRQAIPALNGLGTAALSTRISRLLAQRALMPAGRSRRIAVAGFLCLPALAVGLSDIALADRAPVWARHATPEPLIRLVQDQPLQPEPRVSVRSAPDVEPPDPAPVTAASKGGSADGPSVTAHLVVSRRSTGLVMRPPVLSSSPETTWVSSTTRPSIATAVGTGTVPVTTQHVDTAASHGPSGPVSENDAAGAAPGNDDPGSTPPTPWEAAADAGAVIGERSQEAGVATGALFQRLGRRIASAF